MPDGKRALATSAPSRKERTIEYRMQFGKTEIKAITKVLEEEHETVEAAAGAVLEKAFELYENAARWIPIAQQYHPYTRKPWPLGYKQDEATPAGHVVAFPPTRTYKQAAQVAYNATCSSNKAHVARTWALPIFYGTPAKWYGETTGKKAEDVPDDGLTWGVRHNYIATYDFREEAEHYAEMYGGVVVFSKDKGDTWEEAA